MIEVFLWLFDHYIIHLLLLGIVIAEIRYFKKRYWRPRKPLELASTYTQNDKAFRMPLTLEDVSWYVGEVKRIDPKALKGISKIILSNRDDHLNMNIMGEYSPNNDPSGPVIRLFPMEYHPVNGKYSYNYSDLGMLKVGYNRKDARDLLLSTLGHEIGHHVKYKETKELYGDKVEAFCDQFSSALGITVDPETTFSFEIFHIDEPSLYIEELKDDLIKDLQKVKKRIAH